MESHRLTLELNPDNQKLFICFSVCWEYMHHHLHPVSIARVISRMQPWDSNVLLRSSGWFTWLRSIKASTSILQILVVGVQIYSSCRHQEKPYRYVSSFTKTAISQSGVACVFLLPSLFALHVWRPVCKPTLGEITFQVGGTCRVSKACEEQVSRFSLLDYKPHVGRAKRRVSVFWCLREYLGVNKIMRGYVVKEILQVLRVAILSPCYREVKCQISPYVLRQTSVFFQKKKMSPRMQICSLVS